MWGAMALSEEDHGRLLQRLNTGRRGNPNCKPNKLSAFQREQLVRHFINGWSPVELAAHYGIRRQTVDYHLLRAAKSNG